jgi:hypothetical protein
MLSLFDSNRIKKNLIDNLCRLYGDSIVFIGSLPDCLHTNKPLNYCKDLDLLVYYENKDEFFDILYREAFLIDSYKVRLNQISSDTTKISRFLTPYQDLYKYIYKYAYSLDIFGIHIDIFFYTDYEIDSDEYWISPILEERNNNTQETLKVSDGFIIDSAQHRIQKLKYYSQDTDIPPETRTKHLLRLRSYSDYTIYDGIVGYTNFFRIPRYTFPKNFTPENYLKKNQDLIYLNSDSLVEHYLSHGMKENRRF